MDLFSVVRTLMTLIGAIDAYSTSPKTLAASLKTLRDELTSTRGLFVRLEELVKEESGDTRTLSSNSTSANLNPSSPTLQLINNQGQLQVLQKTLDSISAWLDDLKSKSKSKKLLSMLQLRSPDDLRKASEFLVELERCKSTASLVLSVAIRYENESAEQ